MMHVAVKRSFLLPICHARVESIKDLFGKSQSYICVLGLDQRVVHSDFSELYVCNNKTKVSSQQSEWYPSKHYHNLQAYLKKGERSFWCGCTVFDHGDFLAMVCLQDIIQQSCLPTSQEALRKGNINLFF